MLKIKYFFFSQVRTDNNSHKRGPKRKTQSVSILKFEFCFYQLQFKNVGIVKLFYFEKF